MGRKKLTDGRDPNLPFICSVCGDMARGNNFSVMSCVSCKSFFRRYGLLSMTRYQCKNQKDCIITKELRGQCIPCRLKKCLESGMDPKMIRCPPGQKQNSVKNPQNLMINKMQLQLPMPKPLNLLRNDCSTLTSDQWNLVSNMIRSYDEQDLMNRFKNLLNERSSLPPKIRLKPEGTFNLMGECVKDILPLTGHSPHFRSLSSHAHRKIISHNLFQTGILNGELVAHETNAFRNQTFVSALATFVGHDFAMKGIRDDERFIKNGNIVKLMLFVMAFSSNYSLVMFNDEEDLKMMSSAFELFRIQNIYVTTLWKYLVYLYGYKGAVMQFSTLMINVTDMLYRTEIASKTTIHIVLVDRIVTQMEHSLGIKD